LYSINDEGIGGKMTTGYAGSIDQGTTGTRFVHYDKEGDRVGCSYREQRQIFLRPGWVKHDPAEIWSNVRCTAIAILMLTLLTMGTGTAARTDPSGKIKAILLGDVIDQYGGYNSFKVIDYDPAIEVTCIPSNPSPVIGGYDVAQRNLRVYMPRTYEILVQEYNELIFSDAVNLMFKPEWIHWLSNSITDGGLGMLWLGSITATSHGWEDTTVAEVLPASQHVGEFTIITSFLMRILDADEPLMQALPWEEAPPLMNVNAQVPKEGSEYWAKLVTFSGEYPLMTYWRIGEGSALNFASKFPNGVRMWARNWPLFPQAMIYLNYRVSDKKLPDDPFMFLSIINGFIEFAETTSLIESMLEWVETFEGNTRPLRERVVALDETKLRAEEAYMGGDFNNAHEILADAKTEQAALRVAASRAKDDALFWIYLTEWFALTGAFLVSSYVLWTLMVRRKLYRDVGVSRLETKTD
jgi:hypothetical protein